MLGFTAWSHMVTKLLHLNFGQGALVGSPYFPLSARSNKEKTKKEKCLSLVILQIPITNLDFLFFWTVALQIHHEILLSYLYNATVSCPTTRG